VVHLGPRTWVDHILLYRFFSLLSAFSAAATLAVSDLLPHSNHFLFNHVHRG
jgi:hypothetical protein